MLLCRSATTTHHWLLCLSIAFAVTTFGVVIGIYFALHNARSFALSSPPSSAASAPRISLTVPAGPVTSMTTTVTATFVATAMKGVPTYGHP